MRRRVPAHGGGVASTDRPSCSGPRLGSSRRRRVRRSAARRRGTSSTQARYRAEAAASRIAELARERAGARPIRVHREVDRRMDRIQRLAIELHRRGHDHAIPSRLPSPGLHGVADDRSRLRVGDERACRWQCDTCGRRGRTQNARERDRCLESSIPRFPTSAAPLHLGCNSRSCRTRTIRVARCSVATGTRTPATGNRFPHRRSSRACTSAVTDSFAACASCLDNATCPVA